MIKQPFWETKSIAISYILTLISWFLCLSFGFIVILLPIFSFCNVINPLFHRYLRILSVLFYGFGMVHVYLLFVFRLRATFISTALPLSLLWFTIFIMLYITQIILISFRTMLMVFSGYQWFTIIVRIVTIILILNHIIGSVLLVVIFVRKSVLLSRKPQTKQETDIIRLRINSAVKYINCVIITFISTAVISIITTFLSTTSINKNNIEMFTRITWISMLLIIIDGFLNVFFVHLQFVFMNKCYILLCEPFRIEINSIFNKYLSNIELTVGHMNITNTNRNSMDSIHTNTANKDDSTPEGLEPTKTFDNDKTSFEPSSATHISYTHSEDYYYIYLCICCPIITE